MKNKFIKSTFILIIGGFIVKILGFIIKLLYTRIIGPEGIGLYSLIIPSYSLFITIATLAMPVAISKLVAEGKYPYKDIFSSAFAIIFLVDAILIFFILTFKNFISVNLLNEPRLEFLFIAITITIPFISATTVYKGYFLGKQNMIPNTVSNIFEQILRIVLIILFLPIIYKKSIINAVAGLILLSVFSESLSLLIFLFFMRKEKRQISSVKKDICHDILKTAIPSVSSRLVGNIGFFFEPVILTNLLLYKGFSSSYIIREYGSYNAYAIALLTMPSFFIMAISSSLIPEISKYYIKGNITMVKKRIKEALLLSLIIGSFFSMGILFFREPLLKALYGTNSGSEYIKVLAPFFVLFYLEGPLSSTLQATNMSKQALKISTLGVIVKLLFMTIFSLLKCGILSLVYAEIINIFFVVLSLGHEVISLVTSSNSF